MDQDSGGSEEEELTCQLYSTLRKHLGRWVWTQQWWLINFLNLTRNNNWRIINCQIYKRINKYSCILTFGLITGRFIDFSILTVCYLKCPLGGSCGTVLKPASCHSSEPLPFSSTTWTLQCPLLTCWVTTRWTTTKQEKHYDNSALFGLFDCFVAAAGPAQWEALCSYLSLPSNLLLLYHSQVSQLEPLMHR